MLLILDMFKVMKRCELVDTRVYELLIEKFVEAVDLRLEDSFGMMLQMLGLC